MEHAAEILPYAGTVIGALIVYILSGVKSEIKDIAVSVKGLEKDLREGITALDRRVSKIEARCEAHHER